MENENINRKDTAKEKIILFVIGVLVGAVISTAAFFVYTKTLGTNSNSSGSSSQQMPGGGTPPEMPSGQNGSNSQGGTPPEKPSDENNSESNS
jgi:flagellar basal body-associated protein FliL